jgi:hypothetical protein
VGIEDEVRRRVLVDHLEVVVFRRLENVNRRLVDDIADGLAVFFWLAGDQIDACEWHGIAPLPMIPPGETPPPRQDGPAVMVPTSVYLSNGTA